MRIAFVGNQDNNAYRICRWMRESGADAHLYMITQERGGRSQPEFIDVELSRGYPVWIHFYDDHGATWFLKSSGVARRIEEEYDIVVTSGATGLLAGNQFRRIPVVHLTLGSEVSDFPLKLFKWDTTLPWRGVAWLSRRALKHARRIVIGGFWGEMQTLSTLGLLDKTLLWSTPEDCKLNRSRVNQELLGELNQKYAQYERVFVWLGRLNFLDQASFSYKGPERFLEGFERVIRKDGRRVRAIVGTHGDDVEAFQALVRQKGLEEYVDYVPHLSFWQVLTNFSISNAVVLDEPDVERAHIPGGLIREAVSLGAVVIAYWDDELFEICYGPDCPILKAWDGQTCYEQMSHTLALSPTEFRALQQRFTEWASAYLHYDKHIDKLLALLRETVYCDQHGGRQPAAARDKR